MDHEKILIREGGRKVKITISLTIDYRETYWHWRVEHCEKGKRTWRNPHSGDSHQFRSLNQEGRLKFQNAIFLQHVTKEEVLAAAKEVIDKITMPVI